MRILVSVLTLAFILSIGFSSCKKEETLTEIKFEFKHFVGSEEVSFEEIIYKNAFGNEYSVNKLQYFISDIYLHENNGKTGYLLAHYVDALETSTLSYAPGIKVDEGSSYTKISFTYGLDSANNQTGRFPNSPENLMEWPVAMGGGYHYMKLEGKFDSTGVVKNFQAHTGPTMGNDNSFEVMLDNSSFTTSGEVITITIEMDINKWWENPNTLDLNNMSGIMGNQPMQEKLKANGTDVFSVTIN